MSDFLPLILELVFNVAYRNPYDQQQRDRLGYYVMQIILHSAVIIKINIIILLTNATNVLIVIILPAFSVHVQYAYMLRVADWRSIFVYRRLGVSINDAMESTFNAERAEWWRRCRWRCCIDFVKFLVTPLMRVIDDGCHWWWRRRAAGRRVTAGQRHNDEVQNSVQMPLTAAMQFGATKIHRGVCKSTQRTRVCAYLTVNCEKTEAISDSLDKEMDEMKGIGASKTNRHNSSYNRRHLRSADSTKLSVYGDIKASHLKTV